MYEKNNEKSNNNWLSKKRQKKIDSTYKVLKEKITKTINAEFSSQQTYTSKWRWKKKILRSIKSHATSEDNFKI